MLYLSGTSPLYVLETIFHNKKSPPSEFQCIGAVSLIIWSLILVVSIKYSIFILKADNKGEGKNKKIFFRKIFLC
jgi:KUP system potassium uptake protein